MGFDLRERRWFHDLNGTGAHGKSVHDRRWHPPAELLGPHSVSIDAAQDELNVLAARAQQRFPIAGCNRSFNRCIGSLPGVSWDHDPLERSCVCESGSRGCLESEALCASRCASPGELPARHSY